MSLLVAASRLLRSGLKSEVLPVARLSSKSPKHPLSAADQAIGMTALFVAILGPSGWVLAHMEDYKNKEKE